MSADEYPPSTSGGEENSSLSARRARLRGNLAKQAAPPDPYSPDPYMQTQPTAPAASNTPAATETISSSDPGMSSNSAASQIPSTNYNEIGVPDVAASAPAAPIDPAPDAPIDPAPAPVSQSGPTEWSTMLEQATAAGQAASGEQSGMEELHQQAQQSELPSPSYESALAYIQNEEIAAPAASASPDFAAQPVSSSDTTGSEYHVDASTQMGSGQTGYAFGILNSGEYSGMQQTNGQSQTVEILNNIDQAMGACAMNLSELQKISLEQTEALRAVAQTLQNQSLFEIGLNLNTVMEGLSAALEPMKAVGELVPAIDQLVSTIEAKEKSRTDLPQLSRDELVTSLVDQLSSEKIDPWTFRCAYKAVFPDDHPADLLHRLVGLLGAQRLSGDLFRAAYDAVQAADPPSGSHGGPADETLLAQIENLRTTNDEFRRRSEDAQKRLEQREEEFSKALVVKEGELQESQKHLNSRLEEFNSRYEELTKNLQRRDEVLKEKEDELTKKGSENSQLRAQIDELQELMTELQKQISNKPAEKQAGFFDTPNPAANQQALFDANQQNKPLFNDGKGQGQPNPQGQQNQQGQHMAQGQPMPQGQQQMPQGQQIQQPQMQQPQMQQPQMQQPQQQQPQPQQQMPQPGMQPQMVQQQAGQPQMAGQMAQQGGGAPQQMVAPQPQAMAAPAAPQQGQHPNQPSQQSFQPPSNQAVPKTPEQPTTPFAPRGGMYSTGVRAQVFEVIVRQALAGAPWREICAGPMQVNNITPEEVETEVKHRQALLKK